MENRNYPNFAMLFPQRPQAFARIKGNGKNLGIIGMVRFYQTVYGVFVIAEIKGLPDSKGRCESPVFGFHIHEGCCCTGNASDAFASVGSHYNPYNCPHPRHAGDMPPLFGANGYAFSAFLTNRFTVKEIIGKTVIIHSAPDDFTSQPSGNSGEKIACGEILAQAR
ncbi:MAG: superoxide dismutase family protein [Clostridia bacterium]|nr:superoxide dismutase family protein [Clostridia bacterium]